MLRAGEAFQRREISYQFQSRSSGTLEPVFPLRGKNFRQNKLQAFPHAVQLSVHETLHKVSLPWRAYHSANSFWKVIVKVSEGVEKYFREYLKAIVGNACVNIQVFSAKGWAFPRHTSRDIPLEHDEKSSLRFTQLNRFKPKTRRTRTSCIINSAGFSLESSSRMLDESYESTTETVIKGIGETFNCAVTIPFDERTLKALFVTISSRACFELKGKFSLRCTFLQEQFVLLNNEINCALPLLRLRATKRIVSVLQQQTLRAPECSLYVGENNAIEKCFRCVIFDRFTCWISIEHFDSGGAFVLVAD